MSHRLANLLPPVKAAADAGNTTVEGVPTRNPSIASAASRKEARPATSPLALGCPSHAEPGF